MSGVYRRPRKRRHRGKMLAAGQAGGGHCTKKGSGQDVAEAEVRFHALMRERGYPQFRVVRAYDCPYCPRWHTTSEALRMSP